MNNFSALSSPQNFLTRVIAELKEIPPFEHGASKKTTFERIKIRAEQLANEPSLVGTTADLCGKFTLARKNDVMRTMRIVTVPVAAVFLGAQPADLQMLHEETGGAFGGMYLQALCFSIDELHVIAKHPHWLHSLKDENHHCALDLPGDSIIARATWVGLDVATGYLQIGNTTDLSGLGCRWYRRRPVRLSNVQQAFAIREAGLQ